MPKSEVTLEDLAIRAKNGDTKAFDIILKELNSEIRKLTSKYYIPGSDSEDTLQEAYIGIWKAVEDWTSTGGMSFKNFAINICCKRHIITAMSAANRKKYDLLNTSISLSLPIGGGDGDSEQYLGDFLPDPNLSPQDQYIADEEYDANSMKICNKLTDLEKMIFWEYMKGQTYSEIADVLDIKTKAVDNALMRIRKKASTLWHMIERKESGN
jgi:RNA polymerase sporulation-specific sigma factor